MLEGNTKSLAVLKATFPYCTYGKAPALPYKSTSFDLIHSSHLIEHLTPQEVYDFLKESDRCLKPGGYLIISAPLLWSGFYDDLSHVKPYNPMIFERYLCVESGCDCTRSLLSKNYVIKEKIYRYYMLSYDNSEVFIRSELLNMLLLFYKKIKYKLGFRKLKINGFTLVLQKQMTHTHSNKPPGGDMTL